MKTIKILLSLLVLAVLGGAAFVWSGVYPIGADVPHSPLLYNLMETMRQRSIALRAKDIQVPPLDDPKLIADGAEHYSAMCTGCHLAPGVTDSEIRPGLYPQPPDLTKPLVAGPAEKFWAIKHGIKMSAMPAWGTTHDDHAIWGMVAFLQKLPGMTSEQYKTLTGSGEENGEQHHHQHGDADHGHDELGGASETSGAAGHEESGHQLHEHSGDAEHTHEHTNADGHDETSGASLDQRQAEVSARGPDVMPFSLDATQHVFEKTSSGGTQRVLAREGHPEQVGQIREHLKSIAQAFTTHDFSGPTHIHGASMPGLAELKVAPNGELSVSYRDIDNGGEVTYRTTTEALREAVHRWFDAQLADHGADATDHVSHTHGGTP
ncbi:MAG: c-type cytochrome [Rudaea sp.]